MPREYYIHRDGYDEASEDWIAEFVEFRPGQTVVVPLEIARGTLLRCSFGVASHGLGKTVKFSAEAEE